MLEIVELISVFFFLDVPGKGTSLGPPAAGDLVQQSDPGASFWGVPFVFFHWTVFSHFGKIYRPRLRYVPGSAKRPNTLTRPWDVYKKKTVS